MNGEQFRTKANIAVQQVDLGRMLKATNLISASLISGRAVLEPPGNSMATMLAMAMGRYLTMAGGGELSALLVDLSGLQFGNALLSARQHPDQRDRIRMLRGSFCAPAGSGLGTRALLLDTTSDITTGGGVINLRTETLAYQMETEAKHFTIGTLSAGFHHGLVQDPRGAP